MKFITSQLIIDAANFAKKAHAGQTRRDGRDFFATHVEGAVANLQEHWYGLIPESSRENFDEVYSETLAAMYLHDTLEDTKYTKADLLEHFPVLTVSIVDLVTRREGQTYYDFIGRILDRGAHSMLAAAVKKADLMHNISDGLEEGSMKDKYRFAFHILQSGCPPFNIAAL